MSGNAETTNEPVLPGSPGKALSSVWGQLSHPERAALLPHLVGATGADWVANELTRAGHPIGATSIKNYRRALRQEGVQL